jgi:hypothetical protein
MREGLVRNGVAFIMVSCDASKCRRQCRPFGDRLEIGTAGDASLSSLCVRTAFGPNNAELLRGGASNEMLARSQTRRVYMKLAIASVRMLLLTACIGGVMLAKDPAKAIAHDTKEAAAATGKAVGRGARDTAKGVKKGSKEVAHGTAKTAEETGHIVKKAGKETGKGVKRAFDPKSNQN